MLRSRTHLVFTLAALLPWLSPVPGVPVPAAIQSLLKIASMDLQLPGLDAARPEPIEVEPVGSTVSGEAGSSGE